MPECRGVRRVWRGRDTDDRIAARTQLALNLQLRAPLRAALLARDSATAGATGEAPVAASSVEDHLNRVVGAEGSSQRVVEVRPLAPDDEQEPADRRLGHAYIRLDLTEGNQRMRGEPSQRIVSSRWAPVEMRQKGAPISSSRRSR